MNTAPKATTDVAALLERYRQGDASAFAELVPIVQAEMHRLAKRYIDRERRGHTLQPTALVNEAFIILMGQRDKTWQGKSHFLAVAALAMRQVLIDYARKRLAQKRDGGVRVTLDERIHQQGVAEWVEILALEKALEKLAAENPRQAKIVELRYFGGLSIEEAAEVLGTSARTVRREWTAARLWLFQELRGDA